VSRNSVLLPQRSARQFIPALVLANTDIVLSEQQKSTMERNSSPSAEMLRLPDRLNTPTFTWYGALDLS
jgi:hypothetical protein